MKHLGDITKISGHDVPLVDVITGGSPCQDLSIAGKRKGLEGERSGLFMEQIRIIKEMRDESISRLQSGGATFDIRHIQPRYMVWENVPGAFSSNKGEDFRCVLEEVCRVADKTANVPMPEKRKWSTSGCIMGDNWSIAWRVHDAQFWGVPQRRKRIALVADFGGESAPKILFERKGLSGNIEESRAEGQGTTSDTERSVDKASVYNGSNITSPTNAANPKYGDPCHTLTDDSRNYLVYFLQGNGIDRADTAGCNGKGWRENQCYTLNTIDRPAVCAFEPGSMSRVGGHYYEDGKSGTLVATDYKGPQIVCNAVVRRLTPLECERLQGFPDNWTNIGEWIDTKGKKHKDADSPRYKALGNSIALPSWERMVASMVKELNVEHPTMASLFDGIGGFPLVYSRCGCEPIWASEIEEFPIAVTKIRFPE